MENILNFLIEISKLKEIRKKGWILMRVKNPETIAEHIFRVTFAVWLLGKKKKLNRKKLIQLALFHDLCEVYAGDMTPLFYWEGLDRRKKEDEKILLKGIRLSKKEKERRGKMKFEKEKISFLKVISFLKPNLKKEIFSFWLDYEKRISSEAKFVKQVDRIETLIQSIEYFGINGSAGGTSWWEGTEEIVDDPLLLEFLDIIQKKFYGKTVKPCRSNKELENILNFILEIGKLKRKPRKGWIVREVKDPETMGGYIFMVTLMVWIFAEEEKAKLNIEKLLKMALCHKLPMIYLEQGTPYNAALDNKTRKERRKILKKWIRFSKKEKMKTFIRDYKKEKNALEKLVLKLPPDLKKEIIQLWDEFKNISSPEAQFLNQFHILANLLQALQYWKKDKKFPIDAFWEWAFEGADNQTSCELIDELKRKFYPRTRKPRALARG